MGSWLESRIFFFFKGRGMGTPRIFAEIFPLSTPEETNPFHLSKTDLF
jgi:hypothetical protein